MSETDEKRSGKELVKMKKLIAVLFAVMMMITAVSAVAEAPLAGGWTPSADPAVTEDIREIVDKALEGLVGVNYVPVAFLGSQVVAGTNYAVLCQATVVYPGAAPSYVILYIYRDLEGNASILNIADFDIGALCTYGAEE